MENNLRSIDCDTLMKTQDIRVTSKPSVCFLLEGDNSMLEFGSHFVFLGIYKGVRLTKDNGLYWDKDGHFYNGTFFFNNFVSGTIVDVEGNVTTK